MLCKGMLRRWDDSQRYLSDNPDLVCEETANYLVIMCIDLEVEEVKSTEFYFHLFLLSFFEAATKYSHFTIFFCVFAPFCP